jgi:hypothetical protein
MIRASALVWAGLVVLAGLLLYQVKHDVQALEEELAAVNRRILATQDRIHVLRAEWSLLNEPARIGDLATRHLSLAPMRPDQFARPADIPARIALHRPAAEPPAAPPPAPAAIAIAVAEVPALPLPPPFPAGPPPREAAPPVAPRRESAARPVPQPEAERPSPARARAPAPAAPPPAAAETAAPLRTAALPARPEPTAAPAATVSALGAPAAALPPPVPRPAGGPR